VIVLVAVFAVVFIKLRSSKGLSRSNDIASFENPLYATTSVDNNNHDDDDDEDDDDDANLHTTTGYMDIPSQQQQQQQQGSGYMDIAPQPSFDYDDEEEDV